MGTRTSDHRRLAIHGFDAVAGGHSFHALLEFQVGDLRRDLRACRQAGRQVSLFAVFLRAVAASLEAHPALNACGGYRTTTVFEGVDIAVPVEVDRGGRVENRQLVLRNVTALSADQITEALARTKADTEAKAGFVASPGAEALLARLPRFVVRGLFRWALDRPGWVRRLSGTTFVTSVSMFSHVPGFILPFTGGPKAVSFAFGSVGPRPWAVGDQVVVREILSLTVSFNHDLVDGAPAARFINDLRRRIETDYRPLLDPV